MVTGSGPPRSQVPGCRRGTQRYKVFGFNFVSGPPVRRKEFRFPLRSDKAHLIPLTVRDGAIQPKLQDRSSSVVVITSSEFGKLETNIA